MRSVPVLFTLLILSLCTIAYGWSKEGIYSIPSPFPVNSGPTPSCADQNPPPQSHTDHEIFRLRDELELIEGEGVTFYGRPSLHHHRHHHYHLCHHHRPHSFPAADANIDFIGVKNGPAASVEDINKAYRKTSARMHPDKFKPAKHLSPAQQRAARKKASERFARLGLIANILRSPLRESYDHFLRNGFPKWRGTGYYYARFRPGIGSVLFGLYLAAGAVHYFIMTFNAKRQREFLRNIIKEVRQAAFGSAAVPGLAQALGEQDPADAAAATAASAKKSKKAKREVSSGESTPNRRKVVGPNGKAFMVEASGTVFLLDETEDGTQELLLDPGEVLDAKWTNTLLFGLPRGLWNITLGRFVGKKAVAADEDDAEEDDGTANGNGAATRKKRGVPKKLERVGDGLPRRRAVKGKAGKTQL